MAGLLPKRKMKPLFIGFGNQATAYAKVFKFLGIKIESVCVRNICKYEKKLDYYKVKNRYTNINLALEDKKFNCVFIFLQWNVIEKKIANIIKKTQKKKSTRITPRITPRI